MGVNWTPLDSVTFVTLDIDSCTQAAGVLENHSYFPIFLGSPNTIYLQLKKVLEVHIKV